MGIHNSTQLTNETAVVVVLVITRVPHINVGDTDFICSEYHRKYDVFALYSYTPLGFHNFLMPYVEMDPI